MSCNRHADCGMLKNVNTYIHTYIHTYVAGASEEGGQRGQLHTQISDEGRLALRQSDMHRGSSKFCRGVFLVWTFCSNIFLTLSGD